VSLEFKISSAVFFEDEADELLVDELRSQYSSDFPVNQRVPDGGGNHTKR
jgi:hypothetical protein